MHMREIDANVDELGWFKAALVRFQPVQLSTDLFGYEKSIDDNFTRRPLTRLTRID